MRGSELMLLGLIALLPFGPKRLPEMGRKFGNPGLVLGYAMGGL